MGGNFIVSLDLYLDDAEAHGALCHDCIDETVNYAEVYELIRAEMNRPSALIEHVAHRLAVRLMRRFDLLRQVDVEVEKSLPPIPGFAGDGVRVSHSLRRRLIAWDFDGTIADTSSGIVRTMTETFRRMGYELPSEEAICATIGLPLIESIRRLAGLNEAAEAEAAARLYHVLFEEVGTRAIALFPGIAEEIRREHECGYYVAIATSRGHDSVERLCRSLGIRECIDYIVACEDVSTHKPEPEPVFLLNQMTRTRPSETTVVGDTNYDILMGKNAGAGCLIGVGWGNHTPQVLHEAGAHGIAQQGHDLASLIG